MKNKKGFTLIEVIAVIVILGLIILIAIPLFQGSMSTFRDDYYETLESSISNSAKEFFKDNGAFLPNRYLDSQKVDLSTLSEKKYIRDVRDYNGNDCNEKDSYVIVIKTGNNKYEYASCTKCEDDEYENTDNIYCSDAWDNDKGFTEVVFDAPPDVYIYRGTSREKLKELVVVYPDIRRCLGVGTCTKEITRVSAKGDMGVQPIYPVNIDSVDPEKVGTYTVNYVYDMNDKDSDGNVKTKTGRVIVYEYKPEEPVFTKYNTIYDTSASGNTVHAKKTKVDEQPYDPTNENDWAQKLNIKFNSTAELDGKKVLIARYQWFLNGRWEDFCVPNREANSQNNECSRTIGNVSGGFELNDNIRFRFIDINGKVSEEKTYKLRIDYTAPDKCSLTLTGTLGTRNDEAKTWYISNSVRISFYEKDDKQTTSGHSGGAVKSGIDYYGITTGARLRNEYADQTADTTGITWYGYVEDKAGNFTVCSKTFKKDSTAPTCTKRGDNTTWKNSAVTVYWGCQDETSKCATAEASKTFSENGTYQKTWNKDAYDIYDKAGNKTTCEAKTRDIYFDKKAPSCSNRGDSTSYTAGNRTIYYGCLDSSETGQSGCNFTEKSVDYKSTTVTATIAAYTIKDVAGNSTNCPARTANVYVDKTPPTCGTASGASTSWATSRTIKQACSDGNSGCAKSSYDTTYTSTTTTSSVDIYDNVGNKTNCSYDVYVDKTGPSCSVSKTATGSTGGVSVSISCSDGQSGCRSNNVKSDSGLKSNTTYTVYDNLGNSGTCSVSITGYDCNGYNCNPYDCSCSNCYYGSNTCQGGYVSNGVSCSTQIGGYDESGSYSWGYVRCSQCSPGGSCPYTGWSCNVCRYQTRYDSCATGSNTCRYGCSTCYHTCYHTCYK